MPFGASIYRMGISYVKHKFVAVDRRLVTDAVDDKLSLKPAVTLITMLFTRAL